MARPSLASRRSLAIRAERTARGLVTYSDRLLFDLVQTEWLRRCGSPVQYGASPRVPVSLLSASPASLDRLVAAGLLGRGGAYDWGDGGERCVWPCAGAVEWFAAFGPVKDAFYQTSPCGEPECPGHPRHGESCSLCGDAGRPCLRPVSL